MATSMQEQNNRFSEMMKAAQAGDSLAYSRLLSAITPSLRKIIQRKRAFQNVQDIEDLVQDVLLSLHSVRETYDPERPFFPWLFAIVRNRLADGARRYARTSRNEVLVDELPVTFADEHANIEKDVYRDPDRLKQAIDRLPQGQREAIQMLKLKEMSLKEVSSQTGSSIASLKVSVHRGIAALRKSLGSKD
jgi:RNA polymerase sigma-70 factor (ECF subfamily)